MYLLRELGNIIVLIYHLNLLGRRQILDVSLVKNRIWLSLKIVAKVVKLVLSILCAVGLGMIWTNVRCRFYILLLLGKMLLVHGR